MRKKTRLKIIASVVVLVVVLAGVIAYTRQTKQLNQETRVVKLGVVGSIYEELWAPAKEKLAAEGIDLELVQFSDFVTPDSALDSGEIDLNAFQFQSFLDKQVEANGYGIEPIGYTYISRMNLYSTQVSSLSDLKEGDTVAISDDEVNGGRSLKVLEQAGLITLRDDAGDNPTVADITSYDVPITIEELKANTLASVLDDVTAAVVPINYALDYGLQDHIIYTDESLDDDNYWIVIAANSDDLADADQKELYKKVIKAFQSDETEKLFDDTYDGNYVKAGWDKNLLD